VDKLNLTCKKGRPRGRRRRPTEGPEGESQQPDGIQMKCECEPSASQFGIGGCSYPHRERRKKSLVHGRGSRPSEDEE
jgi:hypothetical protein